MSRKEHEKVIEGLKISKQIIEAGRNDTNCKWRKSERFLLKTLQKQHRIDSNDFG